MALAPVDKSRRDAAEKAAAARAQTERDRDDAYVAAALRTNPSTAAFAAAIAS